LIDPAINQFLSSAPPEVAKFVSSEWPTALLVSKKLDAKEQEKLRGVNKMLTKAKTLGECIHAVAVKIHKDLTVIVKNGAAALIEARKVGKQLEQELKKEQNNINFTPKLYLIFYSSNNYG
jgi:hypothetical protein